MSGGDLWTVRKVLTNLQTSLRLIVEKDSEQEVRGIAIPVLDAALGMV